MAEYALKVTVGAGGAGGGGAYGTHLIAPSVSDVWVRVVIKILSGFPRVSGSSDVVVLSNGEYGWFLDNDAPVTPIVTYWADNSPFGDLPNDTWITVDYRAVPGTPLLEELWIDNVDQGAVVTSNDTNVIDRLDVGARFNTNSFSYYLKDISLGTTRGGTDIWLADLSSGDPALVFDSVTEGTDSTLTIENVTPVVPGADIHRHWRYLLADLDGTPISFWDVQARNRSIEYVLNDTTTIRGEIDSDNPQANLTFTDGFPYLSEGDRLLYAFRRDYDGGGSSYPWTCRAAGIIMELTDNGGVDNAVTEFTAYDPWQYLMSLPLVDPDNPFDGTHDVTYVDYPLDQIVVNLLTNIGFYNIVLGGAAGIDLTGGTIESLPNATMTFQRETSIGQCLQQCCEQGCDIVLSPVYDPSRPGILCDLNVYAFAGDLRPDATFAWDKGRRSVVDDNRQIDGTQRQNNVRYHVRAKGDDTETTVTVTESASVTRFGDYWGTQYLPAFDGGQLSEAAQQTLSEFSENKRTVSLGPVPERSPDPFTEWYLGDFVRVYASKKLRASQSGYQRVTGFTVEISDDALETVRDLRVYIPLEPAS